MIATVSKCPSCSASISASSSSALVALCPKCSSILPPPTSETSHFTLFDLSPPSYKLDKRKLRPAFLKFQSQVHPDRFASSSTSGNSAESGSDNSQERWARLWSTRVNEAYNTLQDDLKRGEYMLGERGVEIGEAEGVTDPELLMQVMEVRERIEEATTEDQVAQIRQENKDEMDETVAELERAFESNELDKAKDLVIKLRYLKNADTVCRDWSPKM